MKKSLIALAALATVATAAQAQSSVTMYGVIDPTLISVSTQGQGRVTALSHGGAATSRWGFRGEEDLGGGLKAFFNLEGQFEADTGEGSATGLFHRASFVGLKNSMISGQAGRMNRIDYAKIAKYDVFAGNNIGGATAYVALSGAAVMPDVRSNNTLQLDITPISGLTLTAQHAFGEVAGSASKAGSNTDAASGGSAVRHNSYAADYKAGALELAAIYVRTNDTNGAKQYERTDAYARYDFGVVSAVVGHNEYEPASGYKKKSDFIGVKVPVGSKTTILANVVKMDLADNQKPTGYGAGVQYALSKRTTAYGVFAKIAQDSASTVKIGGSAMNEIPAVGTAGKDQTGYGVGIRHTF